MKLKQMVPLAAFASLALAACDSSTVPIDQLAEEIAELEQQTETPEPVVITPSLTPTISRPTRTPVPTLNPLFAHLSDPQADCVTAVNLAIDCNFGLQRDVTDIELVSDGEKLTITITIEGQPWSESRDHFATFLFDTDMNPATGSRTLGVQHGIGPEANIFAGWSGVSGLPFGIELYDEVGSRIDVVAERDEIVTIVNDQTLRLDIDLEIIGSETFDFVFSLQSAVRLGIFDNVPEQGEALTFPTNS